MVGGVSALLTVAFSLPPGVDINHPLPQVMLTSNAKV